MTNKIFWIHIPKSAGTAFGTILRGANTYPIYGWAREYVIFEDFINRYNYSLIGGHIPYSLASRYENRQFVTMLRDPLERCISHWNEIKNYRYNLTLEELLEHPILSSRVSNYASRYIGFNPNWEEITINAPETNLEHHAYFDAMNMEMSDDNLLNKCLDILDTFALVAIKERFEESVKAAEKVFSLTLWPTETVNTDHSKDLTDDIIELLTEKNKVDIIIYNSFKKKFDLEML